jgi:hypothetical protein
MPQLFLRITFVPPGEAPAWVREKWVGLKLPLAQMSPDPRYHATGGVLTGPRTFFGALSALLPGRLNHTEGYLVNAPAALSILELAHPEAAAWWRTNTPHLFGRRRRLLFPKGVGDVVE